MTATKTPEYSQDLIISARQFIVTENAMHSALPWPKAGAHSYDPVMPVAHMFSVSLLNLVRESNIAAQKRAREPGSEYAVIKPELRWVSVAREVLEFCKKDMPIGNLPEDNEHFLESSADEQVELYREAVLGRLPTEA